MPKPRKRTEIVHTAGQKTTSVTRPVVGDPTPTGLYILCAEVLHDVGHQVRVEVVECRGGRGYSVFCRLCRERRFLGMDSAWRTTAVTREQAAAQGCKMIFDAARRAAP